MCSIQRAHRGRLPLRPNHVGIWLAGLAVWVLAGWQALSARAINRLAKIVGIRRLCIRPDKQIGRQICPLYNGCISFFCDLGPNSSPDFTADITIISSLTFIVILSFWRFIILSFLLADGPISSDQLSGDQAAVKKGFNRTVYNNNPL